MEITFDNVSDRETKSHCCDARIQIQLRQFTTVYGEKMVWQCNRCGNMYVIGNKTDVKVASGI